MGRRGVQLGEACLGRVERHLRLRDRVGIRGQSHLHQAALRLRHLLLGSLDAGGLGLARRLGIHQRLLNRQLGLVQRCLGLEEGLVVFLPLRVVELIGDFLARRVGSRWIGRVLASAVDVLPIARRSAIRRLRLCQRVERDPPSRTFLSRCVIRCVRARHLCAQLDGRQRRDLLLPQVQIHDAIPDVFDAGDLIPAFLCHRSRRNARRIRPLRGHGAESAVSRAPGKQLVQPALVRDAQAVPCDAWVWQAPAPHDARTRRARWSDGAVAEPTMRAA